tara:strand:+ start:708 stop:884 length:177 start_codon:yes stop_codon:yes gene_type:complete
MKNVKRYIVTSTHTVETTHIVCAYSEEEAKQVVQQDKLRPFEMNTKNITVHKVEPRNQ